MINKQIRRRQQLITIEQALKTRKTFSKSGTHVSTNKISQSISCTNSGKSSSNKQSKIIIPRTIISSGKNSNTICQKYLRNLVHTEGNQIHNRRKQSQLYKRRQKANYQQLFKMKTTESQHINIKKYKDNQESSRYIRNTDFDKQNKDCNLRKLDNNIVQERDHQLLTQIINQNEIYKEQQILQEEQSVSQHRFKKKKKITFQQTRNFDSIQKMKPKQNISTTKNSQRNIQDLNQNTSHNRQNSENYTGLPQEDIGDKLRIYVKQIKQIKQVKKQKNVEKKESFQNQCNYILKKSKNKTIAITHFKRIPQFVSNISIQQMPSFMENGKSKESESKHQSQISIETVAVEEETESNYLKNSDQQLSGKILMKHQFEEQESINCLSKPSRTLKTLKTLKTMKTMDINKSNKSMLENQQNQTPIEFQRVKKIGQGQHSTVWKVKPFNYEGFIAVKKIPNYTSQAKNQVKILRQITGHPYIIEFYYASLVKQNHGDALQILMEHCQDGTLQNKIAMQGTIDFQRVKIYAYQIFRGLHYIHCNKIIHRDIKSKNILLKGDKIVLADFGSAKTINAGEHNSSYVCARSNRAPELVIGSITYDQKIDIWAAGCVIIEMILGRSYFNSYNSDDLIIQIIKTRSVPSVQEINQMDNNAEVKLSKWKISSKFQKKVWEQILQQTFLDQDLANLLEMVFSYSPKRRPSALDILCHKYFDNIKQQKNYKEICQKYQLEDEFFTFLPEQIKDMDSKLIPMWKQLENQDKQY